MIARDKVFVVADNVDDSLQVRVTAYDVKVFRTFTEFESYINATPVVLDTLVISARVVPFTGQNMSRVLMSVNSPFLKLNGGVLYLVDQDTDMDTVNLFLEEKNLRNWIVYSGDLSAKFITDVVTGTGRNMQEGINEVVTYRIRTEEYIKQQNQLHYENTGERYEIDSELQGIPTIDEPEEIIPSIGEDTILNYIVGEPSLERSLLVFLLAQYLSLKQKVLILEKDTDYHMLGEILTKSTVPFKYVDVEDLFKDVSQAMDQIKGSNDNLIFIGSKNRVKYDYNFTFDLLWSNLKENFNQMIRECDFDETPYGRYYTVVTQNTVPALLKCCNSLKHAIDTQMVTFVGMQSSNLGALNLTSAEMKGITELVLNCNGIAAQVVQANGLLLKGDSVVYDILGVINRGNG